MSKKTTQYNSPELPPAPPPTPKLSFMPGSEPMLDFQLPPAATGLQSDGDERKKVRERVKPFHRHSCQSKSERT